MALLSDDDYQYSDYRMKRYQENEGPPLITTNSRVLFCVVNNDVEGLKLLVNYPNFFQIADTDGYPILQIAMLRMNIAVFDFLLSLDDCPLETRNQLGETALELALTGFVSNRIRLGEHFAYALLAKGANIDYVTNFNGNSLLHCAMEKKFLEVARLLIEKGADLNCQNDDGATPIHKIFQFDDVNEALAMLLYFGADPSIPDFKGIRLVDSALTSKNLSIWMKEILIFYLFDDYSTGYDIPIDTLFKWLQTESPLFPQVLKYITSVNMDETRVRGGFKCLFIKLFRIKSEYLKLLLEKFDYVIEQILDATIKNDLADYAPANARFIQNIDLLLQSEFSSAVIQIINRIEIYKFIEVSENFEAPPEEIFQSIMLLLSYGANICDRDMNLIYEIFGDCEYFRILLHMDIEITEKFRYYDTVMGRLLYNVNFDVATYLEDCFSISVKDLAELLHYFVNPKLKSFCPLVKNNDELSAKAENLPSVPLLVELARNETRKYLVQKYKITNSRQFYTLIKYLPISKSHEKIIAFQTKLY